MQTAGKAPSVRAMENRIAELEAEIERLAAAHADKAELVIRLQDRIDAVAAFLDRVAGRLDNYFDDIAGDCRAMARKLRGET